MISRDLLSEVLEFKLEELDFIRISKDGKEIEFAFELSKNENIQNIFHINIHELAHKCKEWALNNLWAISTQITEMKVYVDGHKAPFNQEFHIEADTEPEAIFAACQWILENKE